MEIIELLEKEIERVSKLIAWLRQYPGEPDLYLIRKLKYKVSRANKEIYLSRTDCPDIYYLQDLYKEFSKIRIVTTLPECRLIAT